jgi:hypothetical protein
MKRVLLLGSLALFLGLGIGLGIGLAGRRVPPTPDPSAVVWQIREIARLETLDVSLYKKVSFAPEPKPESSLWSELIGWARFTLRSPQGRAIIFADARLGLDLERLNAESVRIVGETVFVKLPPLSVSVELKPDETEVLGSNLNSEETARLFALAKAAFEREVAADEALKRKARGASERAIRALLLTLGFRQVNFVESLPGSA